MSGPPYRAEHFGSLLRPSSLTAAFRARSAGEIDDKRFRRVQDECIREVVALQEEVGLWVVTDGEFRFAAATTGASMSLRCLHSSTTLHAS